jgi:hypothetical protein
MDQVPIYPFKIFFNIISLISIFLVPFLQDSRLKLCIQSAPEKMSILWEITVSVILSKKLYIYICPIPNGFRDRTIDVNVRIKERQDALRRSNTSCPHTSCKVHWCWRWNYRKYIILGKLHRLCHLNNKYRCYKLYVISLSYQHWNCTVK